MIEKDQIQRDNEGVRLHQVFHTAAKGGSRRYLEFGSCGGHARQQLEFFHWFNSIPAVNCEEEFGIYHLFRRYGNLHHLQSHSP